MCETAAAWLKGGGGGQMNSMDLQPCPAHIQYTVQCVCVELMRARGCTDKQTNNTP